MHTIKGLRTEIPEGMQPHARTIAILHAIETHNVVKFQTDDSPDDGEVLTQLTKIAGDVGYIMFSPTPHTHFLIDEGVIEER